MRETVKAPWFLTEMALAIMLAAVVYVQTQRIAEQAAQQNEDLVRRSEINENQRYVRETVIGNSPVMPFSNLDLTAVQLRGLHFGCTDAEREKLRDWKDSGVTPEYVGISCEADFSGSKLDYADLQGAQLRGAIFQGASLYQANLAATNLIYAYFNDNDLREAEFSYSWVNYASFQSTMLAGARMRNAHIRGARFTDVDLSNVDFRESDLTDSTFTRVQCSGTRWPEGFARPRGCD